jgi:hypothetical protein
VSIRRLREFFMAENFNASYSWAASFKNGFVHTGLGVFLRYSTAGCQWLMPIILATQEAETRRIYSG